MRALLIAAVSLLAVAGCSATESAEPETGPDAMETTVSPAAEPVVYDLTDTVTIGNGVTISDMEITTEGCEFTSEPNREAVKFQLVATVENGTDEDITEVLWSSDISFTDPEGLSVRPMDIVQGEPPCDNSNPREFNRMSAGEKRRAAVTIEAPANAEEMMYDTTLIEGAQPVRWDVTDEVADMESVPAAGSTVADDPLSPQTEAPATPPSNDCLVGSYGQPQFQGTQCLDKQIASCGDPSIHEMGTTFFTDGTSGWTQKCGDQMFAQYTPPPAVPTGPTGDDFAGPFEPAAPQSESMSGWHCDGPAHQCRDDDASGKTEGQDNWTP